MRFFLSFRPAPSVFQPNKKPGFDTGSHTEEAQVLGLTCLKLGE